jgi:hypothetical protein
MPAPLAAHWRTERRQNIGWPGKESLAAPVLPAKPAGLPGNSGISWQIGSRLPFRHPEGGLE